jgi:3-deoxy-D-arabino-heptulosonate 7-phosphate (DAHP) synthase
MMIIKLDLEPIVIGEIKVKRPFIISGPCSAESEEQVMSTARKLAEMGINHGQDRMHLKVSEQKDWHG